MATYTSAYTGAQIDALLALAGTALQEGTTLPAGTVYTDTTLAGAIAAGLAGTSSADTFFATGDDVEYIGLYLNDGGSESEYTEARLPKFSLIDAVRDGASLAQTIGGEVGALVTGSGVTGRTAVYSTPVAYDGVLHTVRAWCPQTSNTIQVRRFTRSGTTLTQVGTDTDVSIVSGLNSVSVNIDVNAGEYIGFYYPTAAIAYATGFETGTVWEVIADSSSFTDATAAETTAQVGFDIRQPYATGERVLSIEDSVDTASAVASGALKSVRDVAVASFGALVSNTATAHTGTAPFGALSAAIYTSSLTTGEFISRIEFQRKLVSATATKFRLSIYRRTDGTTGAPLDGCIEHFIADYPLGDLDIVAGDTSIVDIGFDFAVPFEIQDGNHLLWILDALDATDTSVGQNYSYYDGTGLDQSTRGFFKSSPSASTFGNVASSQGLSCSIFRTAASQGLPLEAIPVDVSVGTDGSDIAVDGQYTSRGQSFAFRETLTPTLAAAGKERIDLIQVDRLTRAISLVAGDERDAELDAIEWQGNLTAGNDLIGRAKVNDSTVEVVSTAAWNGFVKRGSETGVLSHIERNRAIMRPIIGKAMRSAAINWGGYGDSITAIQSSTPPYTANGTMRDRGLTYASQYPADTRAQLTLYDTGDGAGQVHTRLGWNWIIKAALDEMAGSEVVTYLNYGIGGTTSQNTNTNGLVAARIAEPLGDNLDAVVIAFGMNERGQSYTYANIVNMIGQFQAVGTIPIVMGCPRPDVSESLSNWRYTNEALEAAARHTGAAYVSTMMIADDLTLGGMGVPASALSSTNNINHPGFYELGRYGASAVWQLGL